MKKLRIKARKSDLARIQVYEVVRALKKVAPELDFEFQFSQSLGDKNLDSPLWQMPEKGVFTRDLQDDLLQDKADLVVHSWKDLPVDGFEKTEVAATLERQEARDLLFFKAESVAQRQSSSVTAVKILSSSPRRAHNLSRLLPDLLPFPVPQIDFVPVRGNVGTRIDKLLSGDCDGLIVAGAALNRLLDPPAGYESELSTGAEHLREKIKDLKWMLLPLKENPTAAAQGALAIEVRRDRADLKAWLQKINHEPSFAAVLEERKILAQYGGGCHQKLGISLQNRKFGRVLSARGLDEKTQAVINRWEIFGENPAPHSKVTESDIWPLKPGDSSFFKRKSLFCVKPQDTQAFFVSRADAMPAEWSPSVLAHNILWASGTKTWKNLAERGYWICGSTEGLGEATPVSALIPPTLSWKKLSHSDLGVVLDSTMPTMATYELVPKTPQESPKFLNKKHYFWMSATAFQRAFQLDPSILNAEHGCGPGNTFTLLQDFVKKHGLKLKVYLDFDHWKQSVLAETQPRN